MSTDVSYVLALMLRALRVQTGSREKAWEAIIEAHEAQMNSIPSELQPFLQDNFDRLIADVFVKKTIH